MRTTLVLIAGVFVAGCQQSPPAAARTGGEQAPTTLGASSVTPAPRAPMSLEEAQRAQGAMAARALSQKAGVPVEPVSGSAPSWWSVGAAGSGAGRGQGATLESAYQAAVRQARGSSVSAPAVSKAAWARLTTGEYVAWVLAGTATPVIAATSPSIAAPAASASLPAQQPPAAPAAAAAGPTPDAPSWFTTVAQEVDGRVQIGAAADAATVREAPRMATEAARAALSQVMGKDAADLRLESTYVKKVGDQYRAYVLVSSPGTIKK